MFGVPPAGAMRLDVTLCAFLECHCVCSFEPLAHALGAPCLDRINALTPQSARFQRPTTGLGKAVVRERPQPHPARPAGQHEPEHPVLRALPGDAQVQAAAVAVHAGALLLRDLERRQSARLCHWLLSTIKSTTAMWIMTNGGEAVKKENM
jgi:hypothetical protein